MYFFFVLFAIKVFAGPRIGKMAHKRMATSLEKAREKVDKLTGLQGNESAKALMSRRRFISSKPVVGLTLAGAGYLIFDMVQAEKSGAPRAAQGTKAMIFTAILIFMGVGQVLKDSSSSAVKKAFTVSTKTLAK